MNERESDPLLRRTEPGRLEEHRAGDRQNRDAPQGASHLVEADAPLTPVRLVQMQASLENKLQELRAEITRQSFAERQMRARAGRRAAEAREEAFDALSRASKAEAQRVQAERERDEALTRASEAERDKAHAEALHAQAERERDDARAEASQQLAALRAQGERERDEARERALHLESSLRYATAMLNSIQKAGFVRRIRQRIQERRQARLIRQSPLFDVAWYVQRYPQVRAHGFDPSYDFLWNAGLLDRDPGPGFDTSWYLHQYADVAHTGMNPLLHYILFGAAEGRQICPVED